MLQLASSPNWFDYFQYTIYVSGDMPAFGPCNWAWGRATRRLLPKPSWFVHRSTQLGHHWRQLYLSSHKSSFDKIAWTGASRIVDQHGQSSINIYESGKMEWSRAAGDSHSGYEGIVDVFGKGWGQMLREELNSWMVENEFQHFPDSFIILNPNVIEVTVQKSSYQSVFTKFVITGRSPCISAHP